MQTIDKALYYVAGMHDTELSFNWEHSVYLISDDRYPLPFSKGRLWPLMAYELTIKVIHSTHPDKSKSGYGHSSNTIMKNSDTHSAQGPL